MAGFSWVADIQASGSITMSNASALNSTISASFRDWTAKVHAAITSGGFVDTLASGSITDPSRSAQFAGFGTLQPPTGSAHYPGFVVYRFNDPLQTTAPIYFRVDYGQSATINRPSTLLTVGTQHDNSGTIAGYSIIPSVGTTGATAAPTSNASRWIWMLGADGTSSVDPYIAFPGPVHNFDNGGSGASLNIPAQFTTANFWSIERTKNSQGSASVDGYVVLFANGGVPGTSTGVGAMKTVSIGGRNYYNESNWITFAQLSNLGTGQSSPNAQTTEEGLPILGAIINVANQKLPITTIVTGNSDSMRNFDIFTLEVYAGRPSKYIKLPCLNNIGGTAAFRVGLMRFD